MARIPTDELERIKRDTDLVALVAHKGIKLERRGQDLVGRCCFHDDDTASLVVTPAKGLWHCFGKCQEGGDVVQWVMKTEGVSFRHAVELLKTKVALSPAVTKTSTVRKLTAPVALDALDQELLDDVARYYHESLKESPEALRYLEERGIANAELIEKFRLGFSNRTLGLRLPNKNRIDGDKLRSRLQALGVIRESGHEHMNGSLVIPILDESGHVQGLYGRKVTKNLRPNTPLHLYLPGPHKGVFNAEALAASKEIVLCEALIDALTFWAHGFRNVTSSYGVEGFTDEMLAAFRTHDVKRVLIAYDRDAAGDAAADKLKAQLFAAGIDSARVVFPKGMDANEYALKVTPAPKSLALVLDALRVEAAGATSTEPAAKEEQRSPVDVTPVAASTSSPSSLAASSSSASAACALQANGDELVLDFGDRRYRVRGLAANTSRELLRVNLLAGCGDAFHVDTLDLYAARQRAAFTKAAAFELSVSEDVVKADLGKLLRELERLQDEALRALTTPKETAPSMTESEREQALALLSDGELAL